MNGLVSEVRKLGVCSRHLMQPGNEASSLLVVPNGAGGESLVSFLM